MTWYDKRLIIIFIIILTVILSINLFADDFIKIERDVNVRKGDALISSESIYITKTVTNNYCYKYYGISPKEYSQISSELGITKNALLNFLEKLGHNDVPLKNLHTILQKIAEKHKQLLDEIKKLKTTNPKVNKLIKSSETSFNNGNYHEAINILTSAYEIEDKCEYCILIISKIMYQNGNIEYYCQNFKAAQKIFNDTLLMLDQKNDEFDRNRNQIQSYAIKSNDYNKKMPIFSFGIDKKQSYAPNSNNWNTNKPKSSKNLYNHNLPESKHNKLLIILDKTIRNENHFSYDNFFMSKRAVEKYLSFKFKDNQWNKNIRVATSFEGELKFLESYNELRGEYPFPFTYINIERQLLKAIDSFGYSDENNSICKRQIVYITTCHQTYTLPLDTYFVDHLFEKSTRKNIEISFIVIGDCFCRNKLFKVFETKEISIGNEKEIWKSLDSILRD